MSLATNQGIRVHYETQGSGTPLTLVHGGTVRLEMWQELGYVDALCAEHQLVLIDARGHGQSDKPHDPAQYRPEMMAGDVVAVLDELGIAQTHYLGASLGGALGFELARYAPGRLRSLTLLGYGKYGPPTEAEQRFALAGLQLFRLGAARGADAVLAAITRPDVPLSSEFVAAYRANDWQALVAFQTAFIAWPGFEDVLPQIDTPCLMLATESDPFYASARRCAEAMPRATFVPLAEGSHHQNSYLPDVVLPHLRPFLAANAPG